MRKIKEVLRLKHACGLSNREIARGCNVARSTVGDYLIRARAAGLGLACLLYTSPSPRDVEETRMPSSA